MSHTRLYAIAWRWAQLRRTGTPGVEMVPKTVQTFMGAFIDAAKEQDFAGRTFSSLFDVHIGLLMVGFGAVAWLVVGMPDEPTLNEQWGQSVEKVWLLMWSSMIFCRVALHLVMKEPAKSQRLGSRFWTVYVVSELIADIAGNAARPSNDCPISGREGCVALLSFAKAVLNGTQGMRFWHKTALVYLMVVDGALLFGGICGAQGVPSQEVDPMHHGRPLTLWMPHSGFTLLGGIVAHLIELRLRQYHMRVEQPSADGRHNSSAAGLSGLPPPQAIPSRASPAAQATLSDTVSLASSDVRKSKEVVRIDDRVVTFNGFSWIVRAPTHTKMPCAPVSPSLRAYTSPPPDAMRGS